MLKLKKKKVKINYSIFVVIQLSNKNMIPEKSLMLKIYQCFFIFCIAPFFSFGHVDT